MSGIGDMPEMPEVETVVRELVASGLPGLKLTEMRVLWPKIVMGDEPEWFANKLSNQNLQRIGRRGKHILFYFSEDLVSVHLRMTGQFEFCDKDSSVLRHQHVLMDFEDGRQLRYKDTRKFGRFMRLQSENDLELGPEAWDMDLNALALKDILGRGQRAIKATLLDQSRISGLGNIYVDESLFYAGIHPLRPTESLSLSELELLLIAMRKALNIGLSNLGTTLGTGEANFYSVNGRAGRNQDSLMVFRRTGLPCFVCSSPVVKITVAQRSTHFCGVCQK